MNVEWDEAKATANFVKHRIDFSEAALVFRQPHLTYPSTRGGEARFVSIGFVQELAIAVIWTPREIDVRRIISARRARREERAAYRQNVVE